MMHDAFSLQVGVTKLYILLPSFLVISFTLWIYDIVMHTCIYHVYTPFINCHEISYNNLSSLDIQKSIYVYICFM